MRLRPWTQHSSVLLMAGFIYVSYGVTLFRIPLTRQRASDLQLLFEWSCPQLWGGVWIAVGLLAIISTRWPPSSKTWGYVTLSGLAAAWASAYLLGVIFLDTRNSAITGALVWYLVAFMWKTIAGLLDPNDAVRAE